MKKHKVLSVFVIIGVVMLILGLLTTIVGFATGGRMEGRFDWLEIANITTTIETENIDYAIKADVTSLEIDISIGDIKIVPNSQNARVEVRNYPKGVLNISEDAGKLIVRDTREYKYNMHKSYMWEITIYLAGDELSTADIETDFGSIYIDGFTVGEIDLDLDAGDLKISNSVFNKLDCSVALGQVAISNTTVELLSANLDAGDFTFGGDITKKADIKNDLGNVTLTLDGAESRYYFAYTVDLGNANINNSSSVGFDRNATYGSSSATVKINIIVDAGNIDVKTK